MAKTLTVTDDQTITLLWTGKEEKIVYDIVLTKPDASVNFWALLIGSRTDKVTLDIKVTHAAPHTTSKINIKSALRDSASAHVNGLVAINHGAKDSNAWLSADIMLLSDKASGLAVPSLEIQENDIKAGHATTIGRVDEQQLFYLQSRGHNNQEAKQLIINGFLQDAIDNLPEELAHKAQAALVA